MSTIPNAPQEGTPLELEQLCRGGFFLPRQLRRDLVREYEDVKVKEVTKSLIYFLSAMTIGWRARFIVMAYSDFIKGPILNNKRWLDEPSGLGNDHAVRDALAQAKALDLIEQKETPWGTAYAIHRRYWQQLLAVLPRLLPKYDVLYHSVYNADADPLDSFPASNFSASAHLALVAPAAPPASQLEATEAQKQEGQRSIASNFTATKPQSQGTSAYKVEATGQQKRRSVARKLEAGMQRGEREIQRFPAYNREASKSTPRMLTMPTRLQIGSSALTNWKQAGLQIGSSEAATRSDGERAEDASKRYVSKILIKDTEETYTPNGASDDADGIEEDEELQEINALLAEKRAKEERLLAQLAQKDLPRFQRRPLEFALKSCRATIAQLEQDFAYRHSQLTASPVPWLQEEPSARENLPAPKPEQASVEIEESPTEEPAPPAQDECDQAKAEAAPAEPPPELTKEQWHRGIFEALCEAFSISMQTMSEPTRKMLNGACKQLRETGILPDQIVTLKRYYHHTFRDAACTPPALAKQAYLLKPMLA